eukprot:scaffold1272_cov250-Pinguiococcus_pyrenoidosus.AAC.13
MLLWITRRSGRDRSAEPIGAGAAPRAAPLTCAAEVRRTASLTVGRASDPQLARDTTGNPGGHCVWRGKRLRPAALSRERSAAGCCGRGHRVGG